MNQKYIAWGLALGAFVVTLAISARHEGLWHSDEPVTQARAGSDATHIPAHPFERVASASLPPMAAAHNEPAAREVAPQAAAPPPPPSPAPMPVAESQPPPPTDSATDDTPSPVPDPDYEQFQAQADRAAERGARSH